MTEQKGKTIVFVGDQNEQVRALEAAVHQHRLIVQTIPCEGVTPEKILQLKPDILVINRLSACATGMDLLHKIQLENMGRPLPIFVIVDDTNDSIQSVLAQGATDYILPGEDPELSVQKLLVVFNHDTINLSAADIDITPPSVKLTKTGVRVFVIEDDPLLKNLLAIRFTKAAFPHEFNSTGRDVVPGIKQFKPNVIILDLMLPGVSGFDVLAEIKNDQAVKDIPVLIFSNRDGYEDKQRAKELGASAFYIKAMTDLSELVRKVEKMASV